MPRKIPLKYLKVAGDLSAETGVPLDNILENFAEKAREIDEATNAPEGKYRVLWVDKFDNSKGIHADYTSREKALKEARRLTRDAMKDATNHSIATVYLVYNSKNNYLGGDAWIGE